MLRFGIFVAKCRLKPKSATSKLARRTGRLTLGLELPIPAKLFAEHAVIVVASDLDHLKNSIGATNANAIHRRKLGKEHLAIQDHASRIIWLADHDFVDSIRRIDDRTDGQRVGTDRRNHERLKVFSQDWTAC
jgi:hypothetical protein